MRRGFLDEFRNAQEAAFHGAGKGNFINVINLRSWECVVCGAPADRLCEKCRRDMLKAELNQRKGGA